MWYDCTNNRRSFDDQARKAKCYAQHFTNELVEQWRGDIEQTFSHLEERFQALEPASPRLPSTAMRIEGMKPRITVITIGVDDLEASLRFYRDGLGLKTEGIIGKQFEHGAVVFFDLQAGLKLAIWPRESITHDTGLPLSERSATEFTLGHNVFSRSEVDAVMKQAQDAGAAIVKPAQDTFWGGYAGYFQDPDGHLWEIVWNPRLLPQDGEY